MYVDGRDGKGWELIILTFFFDTFLVAIREFFIIVPFIPRLLEDGIQARLFMLHRNTQIIIKIYNFFPPFLLTHTQLQLQLQLLRRRLPLGRPAPIRLHRLLSCPLVGLEQGHLLAVHVLHDLIRLPLLEGEADAFVRVVLVVGLVLVVLDSDEVGVFRLRVEGEGDEGVDGSGFGDELEGPGLVFFFPHQNVSRIEKMGVVNSGRFFLPARSGTGSDRVRPRRSDMPRSCCS